MARKQAHTSFLRSMRLARGKTLEDVARETQGEIPMWQLSRIESGSIGVPAFYDMCVLAKYYNIPLELLAVELGYAVSAAENIRNPLLIELNTALLEENTEWLQEWLKGLLAMHKAGAHPRLL